MHRVPDAELFVFKGDMTNTDDAAKVASEIERQFTQLDMVINAIGESDRGSIEKLSLERMLELVRTNVGSSLHVIQHHSRLLKPTRGVLVLIGSLSSHLAPRYLGGYSIAKHGLAALAQQARLELAADGVHVMLASPGPIARDDSGTRYSNSAQAADLPPEALKSGGGAKIKGLDPVVLSSRIIEAAARRRITLILPSKARLLVWLCSLSPSWGEYFLRKFTS